MHVNQGFASRCVRACVRMCTAKKHFVNLSRVKNIFVSFSTILMNQLTARRYL